ncbi:hypothetical protein Q8A73_013254 [Channa argus]|nr:hypothetical protein Q8A73_013254 [Channa argus]
MNRQPSSSNQPSTVVHVNAACTNLYVPLAQLQNTNPLLQDSIIQVLRKALLSAANEIKLLKEENKALKQQRDLLENEQKQVRQLQEELKAKDELLKREKRKRLSRTKAHMDTLSLLTKAEEEIRRNDKLWKDMCNDLEVSLREEMANNKERWGKKVQELEIERNLLIEEQLKKDKEWRKAQMENKIKKVEKEEVEKENRNKENIEKAEKIQEGLVGKETEMMAGKEIKDKTVKTKKKRSKNKNREAQKSDLLKHPPLHPIPPCNSHTSPYPSPYPTIPLSPSLIVTRCLPRLRYIAFKVKMILIVERLIGLLGAIREVVGFFYYLVFK